jgi:hypothetical protein
MGMKQVGAVLAAVLVGLTAAGCTSSQHTQSGQAAPTTGPITPLSTTSVTPPSMTSVAPSSPAPTTALPTASGCTPTLPTAYVRVAAVLDVNGVYWLNGPEEKLECGPGVPDDVAYFDDGSVQTFQVSNTAAYTLRGTDPANDYSVSANTFLAVSEGKSDGQFAWYEGICQITLGQDGRVIAVAGLYTP